MNRLLVFITLSFILVLPALAQDASTPSIQTTSPYSRYGYGVLSNKGIGASRSMGGISYGIRNQNINPGNPASYSGVDTLTFIFDIGVSYTNAKLSENGINQTDHLGGLDFLAIQFPIGRRIGVSAGFLPYSSVGYSFGYMHSFENQNAQYQTYFSGSGGLNQIYGGIAYEPINGLSIGANVSYLYGTMEHDRSLPYFNGTTSYSRYEYRKFMINAAKYDFGIQAQIPISKTKKLTVGATYTPQISPKTRVKGRDIVYSIPNDTIVLDGKNLKVNFPHTFGLGFAISDRKLTFGADATFEKWKDLTYPVEMGDEMDTSTRFNNRWKFNAGVEYAINPSERNFFKRMKFRAGANYSNSYVNVKGGGGYDEYGATIGFGLPFRDTYTGRTSYINIGFEYRRLEPEFKNMIKEEYFGVSLNVNLNDLWFMKNKFR